MKKRYKPEPMSIVRIGISLVFLWFGISQLTSPNLWTSLIPSYLSSFDPITLVYLHGAIETILGFLLLLGIFTRVAAIVLALNLLHTIILLGYNPVAVRDAGIIIAIIAIAINGPDIWCLDKKVKPK